MSNPYRGTIKVRFADTDANGHAFFGNYFVFADEVLGEYWNELGLDVADVVGPDFLTFTVNANMDFLGESLAGDTLEVEVAAEPLAQRQSPRLVDLPAERRVNDKLHATRFVEEPLRDELCPRRQCAERSATGAHVRGQLI